MKRIYIFAFVLAILLGMSFNSNAITYYSVANGTPGTLANWWTTNNGIGTNPANFTTAGDVLTIQADNIITITKLFAGNSASGLTAAQLSQILIYDGVTYFPSIILAKGEIVQEIAIATGTISGSPFCAGTAVSVPFSLAGSCIGGNIFTAQLSDANGSFASPIPIGTLSATTAGTISGTIPPGTLTGTNYRIRVVSNNPVITGTDNGINIIVNPALAVSLNIASSANPACSGSDVTYTATPINGGSTPAYQWKVNGVNTEPNSATFIYKPANYDAITCVLTSSYSCISGGNQATSNTFTMTENALPTAIISGEYTICSGAPAPLSVVLTGSPPWNITYTNGTTPATRSISSTPYALNVNLQDGATIYTLIAVSDANGCTGTSFPGSATIIEGNIWNGNSSSDWNNASNWCNGVPTELTDVIIPQTARSPHIQSNPCAVCKNLNINTSGSLQVDAGEALTVTGNLTVAGLLAIQSTSESTNGSLIVNGTSTGNVTYKRFLENNRWYILSSPVYNAGNQTFLTNSNIYITGGTYNVAEYDELKNDWSYEPSLLFPFEKGKGYLVKLSSGTNIDYTGTLNNSVTDVTVQSTGQANGWNAVGNPFTSALKITDAAIGFLDINADVLDTDYSAIYLWSAAESRYKAINKSCYTPPSGIGSFNDAVVQAGQGFLINVKAPQPGESAYPDNKVSRSIIFNKGSSGMQVHSIATTLKKTEASWSGITLIASEHGRTISTVVAFNENMTTGLDQSFDAGCLSSSDFNIYTRLVDGSSENDFAIQCLPDNSYNSLVVPIGLDLPVASEVTFKAKGVILPEGIYPVIEDRLLQVNAPLKTESDRLTVQMGEATYGIGRFYLHFGGKEVVTGNDNLVEARTFSAYYANQKITLFGTPEHGSCASLYDINGRKLGGEYRLTSVNQNEIPASGLSSGIYLLRIEGKTTLHTLKISILN